MVSIIISTEIFFNIASKTSTQILVTVKNNN